MIRGGPGGCVVCNHPSGGVVNELLRNKNVEIDGKTYTKVSNLLRHINEKFPDNQIAAHNVSRHKNNGHVPEGPALGPGTNSHVAIVLKGGKIMQPQKDGSMREITRFDDPREALIIIASVGVDLIMRGRVSVPAKETIEALKKLSELQSATEQVDQYQEIIADYLRHQKIVDVSVDASQQDILDQLQINSPKGLPMAPTMEDDIILPSEDENDG